MERSISLLSKTLLHSKNLKNPVLIKTEDIGPAEKEYLVEHFLSSQSFHQAHSGEAFILDESGKFLTTLNVNNHVQFELIDCLARDVTGRSLGRVTEIVEVGENFLLNLRQGEKELLVPFAKEIVLEVDISRRELICNMPEGLEEL